MDSKKRSERECPFIGFGDEMLREAWEKGWLDDYANEHFLIRAMEGRLEKFHGFFQFKANDVPLYKIDENNFQDNFCLNFSHKIFLLAQMFGEEKIKRFFTDQLSAGKANYNEDQFFRALSEVSVLNFWRLRSTTGEYEPRTNGKKNPEARFHCTDGKIVDIEVKTPGFEDFKDNPEIVLPLVLLDDIGRTEFLDYCNEHNLHGSMPRVGKLKDFLNSAADKFEEVDHVHHMNLLYVNWTFSEVLESGFEEALSLLAHPINGILVHKDLGLQMGLKEEVYEKITAVIVYTESLSGLMFGELRWIWTRGQDNMPHFGIVGLHNCEELFEVTGMNPYARQYTPIFMSLAKNTDHCTPLMNIIGEHMLKA